MTEALLGAEAETGALLGAEADLGVPFPLIEALVFPLGVLNVETDPLF